MLLKFTILSLLLTIIQNPVLSKEELPQPSPIVSIGPNYPRLAFENKIEGYVNLEFTINEMGSVENVIIIESVPEEIFDREATRAILKFKFKPKIVDQKSVKQRVSQIIEFKLSKLHYNPKAINQYEYDKKFIITSLDITTKKKFKDLQTIDFLIFDVGEEIVNKVQVWGDNSRLNLNKNIKNKILHQVHQDFRFKRGFFKQFYSIYFGDNYPPAPLFGGDSFVFSKNKERIKFSIGLTIGKQGQVVKYKLKNFPKKYKEYENSLKFQIMYGNYLPAKKRGKLSKQKIAISGEAVLSSQDEMHKIWLKGKNYLVAKKDKEWVRMALLVSKNGFVNDVKIIESSDKDYHSVAIDKAKKLKFGLRNKDYQIIKIIYLNSK